MHELNRAMNVIARYFTLFTFSILFVSCRSDYKPSRLPNIPSDANWYGGPDGGNWIKLKKHQIDIFSVKIYNDHSGEVRDSGYYKICKECKINADSIVYLISFYDGERIYLTQVTNDKYCYLYKIQ